MQSCNQYKQKKRSGISIENYLDAARCNQIYNRHYLKSVSETLLLTSCLEITFRGHDESKSSLNRGNFLEIFSVIAKHDTIVQNYINKGPKMLPTSCQILKI